ncbi:MAG: amino-acid N-acetyltransferase [Gammaproteobacteria bacterium]|nr:amino-acid N-acetyltransferase [Gammaproteobacteria bacterium]
MQDQAAYVRWFRSSAPYIHAHRGRTFVIQMDGEAMHEPGFATLVHDVALLNSLGVRLVLVQGIRPQIDERLAARGIATRFAGGLRVTGVDALPAVIDAAGYARTQVEALLSMGLANSPMHGAHVRVTSGNFITARPRGIRDGVDFGHTGEVRRVDAEAIRRHLHEGSIVLVSPLGYSPTGEVFNLRAEDVAAEIAVELKAQKLLMLTAAEPLAGEDDTPVRQLTLAEAVAWVADARRADMLGTALDYLTLAVHACRNGVARSHILDYRMDGALLNELFSRDGVGIMVSADTYEITRRATIDDVGGVLELIAPLEERGALVRRSREKLETEIAHFLVLERDGTVIACAAGYPFAEEGVMELACLAVHEAYTRQGRGEQLLAALEREARAHGATRLFVLTTQATHWFIERGFENASLDDLPVSRRQLYNYERNSKVLIKAL